MEQRLVANTPTLATTSTTTAGKGLHNTGTGDVGYAATAAPSNGPWRPRYAPVYDPYTRTHGMKMKKTTHHYLRHRATTTNRHGKGGQAGGQPHTQQAQGYLEDRRAYI